MEVEIHVLENGEMKNKLKGSYSYSESKSKQEGRPSFFISVDDEKQPYEIHFFADNSAEIDSLIKDLQDLKNESA